MVSTKFVLVITVWSYQCLLNFLMMPLKNKKACQAISQRQSEKIFKKGFIDNLDSQNNPDWVNEANSDSDSEFKGDSGWAVSISKREMPDLTDVSNLR